MQNDPTIPANMKPWHGGEHAPDDWDGGNVLLRSGSVGRAGKDHNALCWQHPYMSVGGAVKLGGDIIAYTPKPAPSDPVADEARAREGETFLAQLRRVNLARYEAWVEGADAGIMFDALELGGEVGELLNVVKKLEREERGWRGSRADPADFADECADVMICLDKLARRRGVDLESATIAKFNATSEKVGLPHMLAFARETSTNAACGKQDGEAGTDPATIAYDAYNQGYLDGCEDSGAEDADMESARDGWHDWLHDCEALKVDDQLEAVAAASPNAASAACGKQDGGSGEGERRDLYKRAIALIPKDGVSQDASYRIALTAAECSALICEHGTRLGLDAFAAATIARTVHNRILEMADVR